MHDNQLVDTQLLQVRQMMTELQSIFKGLQAESKTFPSVPTPITLQTMKRTAPAPHNPISVKNSTSSAKRTHIDVESSSSGSDNDDIIKQQSEINSSMSLMSSKLDKFINCT
ncbi:unnamed protein product [Rhizophagus irregularis]|nr:unnamed protein product [Rhizophagus irregularis]CAB5357733.1 unnamed protein product [Rhizophagus irregularis]